ncbi:hypothetical protein SAMN04488008_1153 [Maribacter orientalis]|uniref:Uncharacterized protein n=1 Tax=Maribacter orientalis TaxID=228957 RepID=A0A1H7XE10_9FLAO|nr:hypothetical protein [Maribacter orientalis]SEM31418.1 hypothetical protein SAMN04488008_1153 [Maribacter orientalis]
MRKDLNDEIGSRYLSDNRQAEFYFDLEPLEHSEKTYHFRYIKSGQIIELYSDDAKRFNGQIVNFIQETKEVKTDYGRDNEPTNYVFEKIMIPEIDASKIGQFMLASKSHKIPTDSLINDWNFNWLDCGIIKFNHKVDKEISNATFTCAHNQNDSVPFVSEIKTLKDTIAQTFQLKKVFDKFTDKLPKGESYIIDGWISMYKLSEKQLEWWENSKPIREYQKTIKDTIDNYLESELNRLIPNSSNLDCFDEFRLTFNKNGKLKSMVVNMGFWERLFDKDYKRCRRILKKAFREIRIDFIDPKYAFSRDLHFGRKEIYISDPTLY